MTTFSSPPGYENVVQFGEPAPQRPRFRRRSPRRKAAIAGGVAVLLVAGLLGASYESSPGGTLWGIDKTVFPGHAQDVALTAVVTDLKKAQDILGSGQQPTPDQLTDARTALNQAKQDLDYLSPSPQQTSLQNLYLQLTQQLLQYTPDSAQQLPALPAAPPAAPQATDPGTPSSAPDAAPMNSSAPTWGYQAPTDAGDAAAISQQSDDSVPLPPDVPAVPAADWSQPVDPPLTPNLQDLGYYDPSWGQLYGYNPTSWYNYDLGGYNQYGYDFLGFDRWGYDRWGYDRWGYDHWGYNWGGCNWAGYDRNGWDRDGRNEWGQRRDHPGDPRDQNWYNNHHQYEQYYQWKFQNDDPVYRRTQWDQAHGFNPNLYQDWNKNRDWHDPRNRDWAPSATTVSSNDIKAHVSSPVVNLNASLAQFISNDKATSTSGPLMKDLAGKSARDVTKDLTARTTSAALSPPASTSGQRLTTPVTNNQKSVAPPALTAPVPTVPPSKVSPGFTAPKLAPVPVSAPPTVTKPQGKQGKPAPVPADNTPGAGSNPPAGQSIVAPKVDSPNPAVVPPTDLKPATPPEPAVVPPHEASVPDEVNAVPRAPASEAPTSPVIPKRQEPPQQRTAPEQSVQEAPAPKEETPAPKVEAPAPKVEAPAPKVEAPAPKMEAPAPRVQTPAPEAPVRRAPAPQAPAPQPVRQAPPVHQAPPPPAPRPAPAPAPRAAPACSTPKCPIP
ncbi:hypothetical protein ABIA30_000212 [Mycobacterium sp. MAA66]|uniref:FIVAR domain-containing protein n=1 Tax=Mycobacterium sp. MAA66 TaxID=3156297 RepID=UPI0035138175